MYPIKELNPLEVAFGASRTAELMPAYSAIPAEFKDFNCPTKWNRVVSAWFFEGLKNAKWKPKAGVDTRKALLHIKAILGSFEPKHEHKEAGVAYLLSEWFEDVTYDGSEKTY